MNTDFTLINCLFGCVKLTKNADPDKYKYNVYDIGFDFRSECLFVDESMGRKSSSVDIDNKGKDILIYGEGPIQGLDYTTLTVETKYPINFTRLNKKFVSNLHWNGMNRFLFANGTKIYQFKAKNSEIKDNTLCLGNISKDFTNNNMKNGIFLLILILLILTISINIWWKEHDIK